MINLALSIAFLQKYWSHLKFTIRVFFQDLMVFKDKSNILTKIQHLYPIVFQISNQNTSNLLITKIIKTP